MNKKLIVASFMVVVLFAGIFFVIKVKPGSSDQRILSQEVLAGEVVIEMYQDEYIPNEITIKRGTTVRFVNKDDGPRWPASDLHPSHGIYSEFDPEEPIPAGEEWSFTFNQEGEWTMHDHLAPYITGFITVVN